MRYELIIRNTIGQTEGGDLVTTKNEWVYIFKEDGDVKHISHHIKGNAPSVFAQAEHRFREFLAEKS